MEPNGVSSGSNSAHVYKADILKITSGTNGPMQSCQMPSFNFAEWYARMGYHKRGGQRECTEALGICREYVRLLNDNKRIPNKTLIKLCRVLELACEQDQIP